MSSRLHRSVALIGFPRSGKSTLGPMLAQALNVSWLDSDQALTELTGHSPAEWIQLQGEAAFRALEAQWLESWQPEQPLILSTGGGLPCFGNHLQLLQRQALTLYLHWDDSTLMARLQVPPHPLTQLYSPEALLHLYQQRHLIYAQADLSLACEGQSPADLLQALLHVLAGEAL